MGMILNLFFIQIAIFLTNSCVIWVTHTCMTFGSVETAKSDVLNSLCFMFLFKYFKSLIEAYFPEHRSNHDISVSYTTCHQLNNLTSLAPVKWAQRKDKLFLTVELRDIKDEKVTWVSPSELKFNCQSDGKPYEFTLHFFGDINTEVAQPFSKKILEIIMRI